jgi:cation:H+ antiporter
VLIIKGGDFFVAAAIRLAVFLRMPRVVIGSNLVSLTTTTPQMVVSVMAGTKGESGLAVGNAIGSVICNIGLILGVTAVLKHVDIHFRVLRKPLVVMFGATLLLMVITFNLKLARWEGAVLLGGGAAFSSLISPPIGATGNRQMRSRQNSLMRERRKTRFTWLQTRWGNGIQFLVGAAIVVLGSKLLVDGALDIAARLGIPSIIVGLTLVAMGRSLPELVTAITSSRKSISDQAAGNCAGREYLQPDARCGHGGHDAGGYDGSPNAVVQLSRDAHRNGGAGLDVMDESASYALGRHGAPDHLCGLFGAAGRTNHRINILS